MAKAPEKTNVMRILEQAGINYRHYCYEHDPRETGAGLGLEIARQLGQDPEQVFKTLVTRDPGQNCFVFVIPVGAELDLKAAATAVGTKSLQLIHISEINKLTGYIRGGCSPIGLKKPFPVVIDETAQLYDTIFFSAGKPGFQVEVAPDELLRLVNASYAAITRQE